MRSFALPAALQKQQHMYSWQSARRKDKWLLWVTCLSGKDVWSGANWPESNPLGVLAAFRWAPAKPLCKSAGTQSHLGGSHCLALRSLDKEDHPGAASLEVVLQATDRPRMVHDDQTDHQSDHWHLAGSDTSHGRILDVLHANRGKGWQGEDINSTRHPACL